MIYCAHHPDFGKVKLVDEFGVKIPMIKEYNTESGEALMYVRNAEGSILVDGGEPVVAKITLKNAKIVRLQ